MINIIGNKGSHKFSHKKIDRTIYWGRILIVQNMGKIENTIIKNFVAKEVSDSSQLSFLKVVNLHAMDAKLNMETIGVINGKTKINKINNAVNPKKNRNRKGTIPTVLSIESIVSETLLANKIRKNNQETLNTSGHNTRSTQKFKAGLSEYHNLNFTKLNIKKITMGTRIIEIKTIRRLIITPLYFSDMIICSLIVHI